MRISPLLSLACLSFAHAFPARRFHGGYLIEAEDGLAPGPAVPELLLDAGDVGHAPHFLDDADLDDEVEALGGGDVGFPHRHLLGDTHQASGARLAADQAAQLVGHELFQTFTDCRITR